MVKLSLLLLFILLLLAYNLKIDNNIMFMIFSTNKETNLHMNVL